MTRIDDRDDSFWDVPIFVVDDVPFSDRSDRHDRPADHIHAPLKENLWDCQRMLSVVPNFGAGQVAMLHLQHPQAVHSLLSGDTLLGHILHTFLERGGWVVLFTGGDPLAALRSNRKVEEAVVAGEIVRPRGEGFELCDWRDLDPAAIRELRFPLPNNWRLETLFTRDWFCGRVLERLAAVELTATAGRTVELDELRLIDTTRFRSLMGVRGDSAGEDSALFRLTSWLDMIRNHMGSSETLPESFGDWVQEVRRRVNPFADDEAKRMSFERERGRLSHLLFGNEFAQRLGPQLTYVDGYWRALEGSGEVGLEDQQESVETARRNWARVSASLKSFFARRWQERNTEVVVRSALDQTNELVDRMPRLAGASGAEKRAWKESMTSTITGIQRALEDAKEAPLAVGGPGSGGK